MLPFSLFIDFRDNFLRDLLNAPSIGRNRERSRLFIKGPTLFHQTLDIGNIHVSVEKRTVRTVLHPVING